MSKAYLRDRFCRKPINWLSGFLKPSLQNCLIPIASYFVPYSMWSMLSNLIIFPLMLPPSFLIHLLPLMHTNPAMPPPHSGHRNWPSLQAYKYSYMYTYLPMPEERGIKYLYGEIEPQIWLWGVGSEGIYFMKSYVESRCPTRLRRSTVQA